MIVSTPSNLSALCEVLVNVDSILSFELVVENSTEVVGGN